MAVVLITGASSGIGQAAAMAFARNGDKVVASMRTPEQAEALMSAARSESLSLEVAKLDLHDSASFRQFVEELVGRYGCIDVLVNNAGVLPVGALEDVSEADIRATVETNLIAPLLLAQAVLPSMRERRAGLIIMMSSLSGIAALPGDSIYSASKFGLEGATEALRHEVDRWNIRVALVQAGMYATAIFGGDAASDPVLPETYPEDSAYRPLIERQQQALRDRYPEAKDPNVIADLFVSIANGNEKKLRWLADDIAEIVNKRLFAFNDAERDEFLRGVAGTDWWSEGREKP